MKYELNLNFKQLSLYYSLGESWWDGWIITFVRPRGPLGLKDFQSGIVSVPVSISEDTEDIEDTGLLVAGTVGYTVDEDPGMFAPVVEAKQSWVLLLPKQSPITPYLTGKERKTLKVSANSVKDWWIPPPPPPSNSSFCCCC